VQIYHFRLSKEKKTRKIVFQKKEIREKTSFERRKLYLPASRREFFFNFSIFNFQFSISHLAVSNFFPIFAARKATSF